MKPLMMIVSLDVLRPADEAAAEMLRAIGQGAAVGVTIAMLGRNARRHRYYWKLMSVAAQSLSDLLPPSQSLDSETLHEEIKKQLGLGEWLETPSGRAIWQPQSTSFGRMKEPDFITYLDRVTRLLAAWLGVPPRDLLDAAGGQWSQQSQTQSPQKRIAS